MKQTPPDLNDSKPQNAMQPFHLSLLAVCFALASTTRTAAAEPDHLYRVDPAKVLGAENCTECHAPMVEAWKLTHHFDTFNTMHRKPEAQEISGKLGFRRIKSESLCVKCHYTSQGSDNEFKVIAGISCESCHNAGADWNKVHSNKDDPDRLKKAETLGMIRPYNVYLVAANCFSCHTVPEEKLVNEAGHKAGSDFELVAWSQGEVRHNLQKSAGKKNELATTEHQRLLYVVGQALDLEYGLRGLAKASADGNYAASMLKRIEAARSRLQQVQKAVPTEEVQGIIAAADPALLKPNNSAALLAAAARTAELTKKFAAGQDGSKLAAVDGLIPKPESFKGKAYQP